MTIGLCTSASKDESPPDDHNPSFGLPDELSCEEELGQYILPIFTPSKQ